MKKQLTLTASLLFGAGVLSAQEASGPDFQSRFLVHRGLGDRTGINWTAWAIAPDATLLFDGTDKPPFRVLALGGVVLGDKNRWIEFMTGGFLAHGASDVVADIRAFTKSAKGVTTFGEAQYSLHARKLLLSESITVPVWKGFVKVTAGGEVDWIIQPGNNILAAGPRVVLANPKWKFISLATAYQFRRERPDIVRTYLLVTF